MQMGLRDKKKEQTLSALIRAGMGLFTSYGFAPTTVDQITAEAGVAKGTFYNYFTTKEDLLVAGMQVVQVDRAEQLQAAIFQLPTTLERLQAVAEWAVSFVVAYPDLAMVWCQERLRRGLAATASGFDLLLARALTEGQATGELRTDRTREQMTTELEGIVLSYVSSWYHGGGQTDLQRAVSEALAAYLTGARRQSP
jgi:AcrR family transcriptional regulator